MILSRAVLVLLVLQGPVGAAADRGAAWHHLRGQLVGSLEPLRACGTTRYGIVRAAARQHSALVSTLSIP